MTDLLRAARLAIANVSPQRLAIFSGKSQRIGLLCKLVEMVHKFLEFGSF
jgi:hypothetical protein